MKLFINLTKHFYAFALVLCASAVLSSCEDSISEIGYSIRPESDEIHIKADTLQCRVNTGFRDSIYVRTGYPLLGNITDPEYGSVKAGYLAQFYASTKLSLNAMENDSITFDILRTSAPADLQLDPKGIYTSRFDSLVNNTLDSLTLRVYYNTYYGDSLTPMQLSIYALNKDARLEKESNKAFYSNYNYEQFYSRENLLGKKAYTAANRVLSDSVRNQSGYLPYIEIRLSDELKNQFLESIVKASIARDKKGKQNYQYEDIFSSIESMRQNFLSGVAIQPTFGDGSIIKVYNTAVWFYYRSYHKYNKDGTLLRNATDTGDSAYVTSHVQYMAVTPDVVQMASLELEDIKKEDRLQDENSAYITSPQGYYATLDLPVGKAIRKMMDDEYRQDSAYFLNGANFSLMCEKPQGALLSSTPVKHVMMVEESKMNRFFEQSRVPDSQTSAIGTYVADSISQQLYYYAFGNLSTLVMGMAQQETNGSWSKRMASTLQWAKNIQRQHPDTFLPGVDLSGMTDQAYNDFKTASPLRTLIQEAIDNYTVRMAVIPVDVTTSSNSTSVLSVSNYILPTAIKVRKENRRQFLQYIYTMGGGL